MFTNSSTRSAFVDLTNLLIILRFRIIMTLEEAIEHCEEKACNNSACAAEHKQLAEWLKELQTLRKNTSSEEISKRYIDNENLNSACPIKIELVKFPPLSREI